MSDVGTTEGASGESRYARAVAGHPAEQERLDLQLEAARSYHGGPDNLDDIERMLASDG